MTHYYWCNKCQRGFRTRAKSSEGTPKVECCGANMRHLGRWPWGQRCLQELKEAADANAKVAHITNCVNAFDDLLAACKEALHFVRVITAAGEAVPATLEDELATAIAKAEGTSNAPPQS